MNGRLYYLNQMNWDEMIKNGHPKSVEVMTKYLKSRGVKIKVFKELFKSEYIIQVNNISCSCKSAREVMEILKGRFFTEKQAEEREYWQKVVRKELKQ